MTNIDKILEYMQNNDGIIESKDLTNLGIERKFLSLMNQKGLIKKATRGIYCLNFNPLDQLYYLISHSTYAVYSLQTALYLNKYLLELPLKIDITVPQGYNGFLASQKNVQLTYVKKEILELGIINKEFINGKYLRVYNIERTILDLIKCNYQIDILSIIRKYLKEVKFNLNLLFDYSEKMNLRSKLETLLNQL